MTSTRALLTGITGQDGSYLAELLLAKDYEVFGIKRRSSSLNTERIDHLYQDPHVDARRFTMLYGDLGDASALARIVRDVKPDEIYNLAAQSHVQVSFEVPEYTADIDALGAVRLLEAIRESHAEKRTKFYQASSSELYGKVRETPQRETTPFYPRSPYAAAKAYAFYITQNYREAYGIFAVNGILFNHESPRRGETFVTRKITRAAARIAQKLQERLYLGNLSAKRDWGFAGDYVEAMWRMLQAPEPDDYVVATGEQHSVRDFCSLAFAEAGLPIEFRGSGIKEEGISQSDGRVLVQVDPRYFRPTEVESLLGDSTKARQKLSWKPTMSFPDLVALMVKSDLAKTRRLVEGIGQEGPVDSGKDER